MTGHDGHVIAAPAAAGSTAEPGADRPGHHWAPRPSPTASEKGLLVVRRLVRIRTAALIAASALAGWLVLTASWPPMQGT